MTTFALKNDKNKMIGFELVILLDNINYYDC